MNPHLKPAQNAATSGPVGARVSSSGQPGKGTFLASWGQVAYFRAQGALPGEQQMIIWTLKTLLRKVLTSESIPIPLENLLANYR